VCVGLASVRQGWVCTEVPNDGVGGQAKEDLDYSPEPGRHLTPRTLSLKPQLQTCPNENDANAIRRQAQKRYGLRGRMSLCFVTRACLDLSRPQAQGASSGEAAGEREGGGGGGWREAPHVPLLKKPPRAPWGYQASG
jgi:hypothetical protein